MFSHVMKKNMQEIVSSYFSCLNLFGFQNGTERFYEMCSCLVQE